MSTLAPASAPENPGARVMPPAARSESPVAITISPELPPAAPVRRVISPDPCIEEVFDPGVLRAMLPDFPRFEIPLVRAISPPEPNVLAPADKVMAPPWPFPEPTRSDIDPVSPEPLETLPVEMEIEPETAWSLNPVLTAILPVVTSPSDVCILTKPVFAAALLPDSRIIAPPLLGPAADPPLISTYPPPISEDLLEVVFMSAPPVITTLPPPPSSDLDSASPAVSTTSPP
mmetsp:Transcript_6414/g.11038  ORF Transcript_6414/g.11038 Transcript_6414/m.11038 type:complete len:231 (+) Transcript_6414:8339-9031(+)